MKLVIVSDSFRWEERIGKIEYSCWYWCWGGDYPRPTITTIITPSTSLLYGSVFLSLTPQPDSGLRRLPGSDLCASHRDEDSSSMEHKRVLFPLSNCHTEWNTRVRLYQRHKSKLRDTASTVHRVMIYRTSRSGMGSSLSLVRICRIPYYSEERGWQTLDCLHYLW